MNFIDFLVAAIFPSLSGYLMSMKCDVKNTSGESVNFRPKPIVFGIVWFLLYILISISWVCSILYTKINLAFIHISYIILNISLCSWIYLYSCRNEKINAIYSLVISLIFTIMCCIINNNIVSQLLLVPLIGWLFLATLINVREVEKIS